MSHHGRLVLQRLNARREGGGTQPVHTVVTFNAHTGMAASFAHSRASLLLLVNTEGAFMQRGASLVWLSTAPHERECVFPPCTYLKPTGRTQARAHALPCPCTPVPLHVPMTRVAPLGPALSRAIGRRT